MDRLRTAVFRAVAAMAAMAATARADLRLDLRLEYNAILPFEPANAFLTICNDSDITLFVNPPPGYSNARIELLVAKAVDEPAERRGKEPFVAKLRLLPDEEEEILLDLSRWYGMADPGRYHITARAEWQGQAFLSKRVALEVVRGIELRSLVRNVPGYGDIRRRYSLRYWPRDNDEHLFLTVDDPDGLTNYGVFPLGRIVRVSPPVLQVDRAGHVVVVHQAGRDLYTRTEFRSERDRVFFVDQTHHQRSGAPFPAAGSSSNETATARHPPKGGK